MVTHLQTILGKRCLTLKIDPYGCYCLATSSAYIYFPFPKTDEFVQTAGKQEYSSRTLGATWGIISAVMVPIVIVLICIAWRLLLRRKAEEKEENDFLTIKPLDPEESFRVNSDDESIPYKKDTTEDTPEPTEPVKVAESPDQYPYGTPYDQQQGRSQARPYAAGETEIN